MTDLAFRTGDIVGAVRLPHEEDECEWLAMNTVDFYNDINMIYDSVSTFCTDETCPVMNAGPNYEYLWADGVKVKRPIKVSAPEYVHLLMRWIETLLEDEVHTFVVLLHSPPFLFFFLITPVTGSYQYRCVINHQSIFPGSIDDAFPADFKQIVSGIFKRLLRVHAHVYHRHFKHIQKIGAEAHLNSSFKHFYFFVTEFKLVNKEELVPLRHLIDQLIQNHNSNYPGNYSISWSCICLI
jgi:MOB kinase activator 1